MQTQDTWTGKESKERSEKQSVFRFDLKFGSDSLRLKNKRQSLEDLQVSSIIGQYFSSL